MNYLKNTRFNLVVCLVSILFSSVQAQNLEPFAVVELFTSEGCYSCPPADEEFKQIMENAEKNGKNVIGIAEHVVMWNTLYSCGGEWEDRFSKSMFDNRAWAYKNQNGGFYGTPQVSVNGTYNDSWYKPDVNKKVNSNLTSNASVDLTLTREGFDSGSNRVTVAYEINGGFTAGDAKLNVVLIENGLSTEVTTGENCGKTLNHDYVARVFKTKNLNDLTDSTGTVEISYPSDVVIENASIVGFVQNATTLKHLGATRGFGLTEVLNVNEDNTLNYIDVYPNPTTGIVSVHMPKLLSKEVVIEVYDVMGKRIYQSTLEQVTSDTEKIDVSNLENGAYLIKIKSEGSQMTKNITISK